MKRKINLFIVCILVLITFTACSKSKTPAPTQDNNNSNSNVNVENDEEETGDSDEAPDLSGQEPYTVKIAMVGSTTSEAMAEISAAMSAITEKKLNTKVELSIITGSSYANELLLSLSGGEKLDLLFGYGASDLVNNGMLVSMDDLLVENAPGILENISEEDWKCTTINGSKYVVPNNKDKAANLAFFMRQDILNELNVNVEDIKNFDDLHDVLVKVKAAHPEMYPVVPDGSELIPQFDIDILGSVNKLGVLLDPLHSDDLTVENWYASDKYREITERMYAWNQEGLIMKDAFVNTESAINLVAAGKGFGFFLVSNPGSIAEHSITSNTQIAMWEYSQPLSTTAAVNIGWAIPYTSEKPDRAMQVLELLYTDKELANIATYGIEGKQWEFVDKEAGIIKYPEGVNGLNSGHFAIPWAWPNSMINYVWDTELPDLRAQMQQFNKDAVQSPAKGFLFNGSDVANEIVACENVIAKYNKALLSGSLNPAEGIPQLLKELEDNGVDKIIVEKQRQLDEWAKTNK